jgi:hypothetical protein
MRPLIPKWHPIRYAAGMPKAGEILVSFIITEEFDHAWKLPNESVKMMGITDSSEEQILLDERKNGPVNPSLELSPVAPVVPFQEYKIELNVLGLRGLASPGLLPVKKAYIDFLLKSMVPPMAANALESI